MIEVTSSSTWQKALTTKWNEYARAGSSKYVSVHFGRVGNKAEGCVIMEPLEPFRWQTVIEMMGSVRKHMAGRRFRCGKIKKSAEGFYYQRAFRGDEMVECPVFKEQRKLLRLREGWGFLKGSQLL